MKKIVLGVFFTVLSLVLTGCDEIVKTEVKVSDLLNSSKKFINGDLYVEVDSCNDPDDNRKLSDSVIKAKNKIPSIFTGAKYVKCFERDFTSYADFEIPILVTNKGSMISNDYIQLISSKNALLNVAIPSTIVAKIRKFENEEMIKMRPNDVTITLINDTNKNLTFVALSSYVNSDPSIADKYRLEASGSCKIKLSNVSIDYALDNGVAPILLK